MTGPAAVPKGRFALGIAFVLIGVLLMLDQAGLLPRGLGRWWPLLIIAFGVVKLLQPREDGQKAMGAALVFVGGWLQVMNAGFWPLILIMSGSLLLWRAFEEPWKAISSELSFLSELALMGGFKKSVAAPDFRGGYITAVMGGVELDLRRSKIATSPAYLDVVALWGGIDIKTPNDWRVDVRVFPLMGGFEDKTQPPASGDGAPQLVIRGYTVMGGMSVGN